MNGRDPGGSRTHLFLTLGQSHAANPTSVAKGPVSQCQMADPLFASAYDAESGLRLLRISGRWDITELIRVAPQDPFVVHAAECVTFVDLRGLDVSTSAGEVEQLAAVRRERTDAPLDRYAWIIDSPRTAGIAHHFGWMVGGGRIHTFGSVTEALAYFDLDDVAYLRTEQSLQPVE